MAEYSYFWNGTTVGDATRSPYDEDEFSHVWRLATGALHAPNQGGVFKDNTGSATANLNPSQPGPGVFGLFPGTALVYGAFYFNDAGGVVLSMPNANSTSRRDRFALRKEWSSKTVRFIRIAGTEGVGPNPYTFNPGVAWDLPLYTVDINTAGVTTIVSDDRVYLPYIVDLATSVLPGVTSIPNLILSDFTKNAIAALNGLTSAPNLDLSPGTESLITSLPNLVLGSVTLNAITALANLISAPGLNYAGLTGLVPPALSAWVYPLRGAVAASDDLVSFNEVRYDTASGAMWNIVNPSHIVCTLTGLYEVSAHTAINPTINVAVDFVTKFRKNGTTIIAQNQQALFIPTGQPGGYRTVSCHPTLVRLNAGDYIELLYDHVAIPLPVFIDPSPQNMCTVKYIGAVTPALVTGPHA